MVLQKICKKVGVEKRVFSIHLAPQLRFSFLKSYAKIISHESRDDL